MDKLLIFDEKTVSKHKIFEKFNYLLPARQVEESKYQKISSNWWKSITIRGR